MSDTQSRSKDAERRALDLEIQQLLDSVHIFRSRRNMLAPINALPSETLLDIFLTVIVESWSSSSNVTQDRIRLAHVCCHWRDIAFNYPLLWSRIDFTSLRGAEHSLALSKTVPLYIHCDADHNVEPFTSIMLANLDRLRECRLTTLDAFKFISSFHRSRVKPPLLESFEVNNKGHTLNCRLFKYPFPFLQRLRLSGVVIPWDFTFLPALTHLSIAMSSTSNLITFIMMLEGMPNVESMELSKEIPSLEDDTDETTVPVVSLPHLSELRLRGSFQAAATLTKHLRISTTAYIDFFSSSTAGYSTALETLIPPPFAEFDHEITVDLDKRCHLVLKRLDADKTPLRGFHFPVPQTEGFHLVESLLVKSLREFSTHTRVTRLNIRGSSYSMCTMTVLTALSNESGVLLPDVTTFGFTAACFIEAQHQRALVHMIKMRWMMGIALRRIVVPECFPQIMRGLTELVENVKTTVCGQCLRASERLWITPFGDELYTM